MTTKRRHTLTLDPSVVAALDEGDDSSLSATVNGVLAEEVVRRQRRQALVAVLDRLDLIDGPVDPEEVDRFRRLLS